jgi:hypothetical protein
MAFYVPVLHSTHGSAMVGPHDRTGLRDNEPSRSWNASHPSAGCRDPSLVKTGGAGLLSGFAVNGPCNISTGGGER